MRQQQMSLSNWEFRACGDKEWLSATVPGTVHTDLLKNEMIPEPFYGKNEHELQWIDKKDWEYRTTIQLDDQWESLASTELIFKGLDTYADVYINDEHALSADNMFKEWKLNVKGLLKTGENEIRVKFRSVVTEDLPKLEQLGYALPAANDQSELGGLDEKRISIFARKAPYHYGWDWGPRFVTSGIWREVILEGRDTASIADLYIRQNHITEKEARLTAVLDVAIPEAWEGLLRISADGQEWMRAVSLKTGNQTVEMDIVVDQPRLWWCRGLGDPHLYSFQAELVQGTETAASANVRTGLREIKLIREKDERGTSFAFELNGVSVFAKGSNHIPNDSFSTEVTEERYRHEIATAVESNMNMLRVWGGGIYEEDIFYRLCDEYGILVWQDFMFACSMYPGDEPFLESVRGEAEYNVKRLRNHPCMALWCGNNEIDSAWAHYGENMGWGWKKEYSPEIRDVMWGHYQEIFHRILPEAVEAHHSGIDYWPSSPLRDLTGDVNQHATRTTGEGDVHYWGVWHATEPFENYNLNVGRFMSEYGFQSFPELKSVMSYAEEQDMELTSDVMMAHQKNGRGNLLIKDYMDMYLPKPKDFTAFLYMSQILQADAIRIAIESHRRNKPFCMGTLYWQMNDCWPVASWAGMDYYGRWKALQYAVRKSYQEIILSVETTDAGQLDVHVVSDSRKALNTELSIKLHHLDGSVLDEWSKSVVLEADSAAVVYSISVAELLNGHAQESVVLSLGLVSEGQTLDSKEHYLVPAKDIKISKPEITIVESPGSGGLSFTVTSDILSRGVYLTSEDEGIFSDNFFDLLPGQSKTVEFSLRGTGGKDWIPAAPKGLKVQSMADFIDESLL
ncbi:beta-mannosidase [Paenibacillus wynnii]|uniref:Beta-mannosidase B n=1 Tax=Paenibacillus wynnii TaxID=268407 RepID=A0A098MB74_9BACL|nr:glycoside hydrolase family 2 protein [Paenibacillus wynnii]KGE19298.1 beta-galactosidase [Paenibacillus wynnii]